jgi:hypothetical protein
MAGRPRVVPAAGGEPGDELVEIRRCDRQEALVLKALLESEGIPTVVRSRIAHSVHPFTVGSQGEVVILVPKADASRAAALMLRVVRRS